MADLLDRQHGAVLGLLGGDLTCLDASEGLGALLGVRHHLGVGHAVGLTLLYQHVVAGLDGYLLRLVHVHSAALLPRLCHGVTLLDKPRRRGNWDLLGNLDLKAINGFIKVFKETHSNGNLLTDFLHLCLALLSHLGAHLDILLKGRLYNYQG